MGEQGLCSVGALGRHGGNKGVLSQAWAPELYCRSP